MFIRFSSLLPVAALAGVVAAAPSELEVRNTGTTQCNTGSTSCCNTTYTQTDPAVALLAGLLGIAVPSISGLVGVSCTPLTIVGTGGGAACTAQPVCCTNNNFNGVINFGCSPININA